MNGARFALATVALASLQAAGGGDTTAPTLSSPTGTATGSTTASGTVSTNEAGGDLYRLASTNATELAATVIAAALSTTVSSTGTQSTGITFAGLTPATLYYAHYVHRDAAGNDSAVATSASFTTTGLPHFDLSGAAFEFRRNNGTLIASTGVTFWVYNTSTGALVATISGLSTNGSGIVGSVSHASLAASTQYRVNYLFSTGEYGVALLTTEA
jgi:hypothetical protein